MRYFFVHYLDNAATTPVPEEVIAAMAETLRHHSGNPSSQYPYGQDGKAVAEKGPLGILTGGLTATSGGIAAAVVFAVLAAIFFKPKEKR